MEMSKCDNAEGIKMIQELGLELKCKYCGIILTEENFGSVFIKPSRASCSNIECVKMCVHDTKEKTLDGIIDLPEWLGNEIIADMN